MFGGNKPPALPLWHPDRQLLDWGAGQGFFMHDAPTGVVVFGATGSGKTSGPAQHLARAYLEAQFSGLVLCAKKEERQQWEKWAKRAGRTDDLKIISAGGEHRFNFLNWEAKRAGAGAGITINIVAMFDEIAAAISGDVSEGSDQGDNKFFADALHHMMTNVVDLVLLSGLPLSLPLMRDVVVTAAQSEAQAKTEKWETSSVCAALLRQAEQTIGNQSDEVQADFEEVNNYWRKEFPGLSEKTRSIITLSFSMLVRPFLTRPLRKLFSSDTTITPEECFKNGWVAIVDLPVQEYTLAGRSAAMVWKYCWQQAILRRKIPPADSGHYLRPVFTWADEAQVFITKGDAAFQAVARSGAGCTVYLTQNLEALRAILGSSDAVQSLLGNLQTKFFAQNTGETNAWASKYVFGERWIEQITKTVNQEAGLKESAGSGGRSRVQVRRPYLEPAFFTTLRRGGERNSFIVECVAYKGGHEFLNPQPTEDSPDKTLPYVFLNLQQKL